MDAATQEVNVLLFGETFLVQPHKADSHVGEIYIPEAAREQHPTGTVVAKGPDVSDRINVGDTVMWLWANEKTVKFGKDAEFFPMTERDLACAILEEGDDRGTPINAT